MKAKLNVEDLEGKAFESFDTTNETIIDCINLALAGTGWIVGTCDVTRRRTVRKTNSSSWDIIQEAKKVYRCELEFDTLNKKINIFEKRGSDKGVYFIDTLNLKSLDVQSDSYDYYTKIIAKGKDDLKVTLENFQYSNKVKTYIWKDERYTDIDSLTEDAEAKLDELSKPYRAYSATIIDLANISKENYKDILSYSLGDIITLVSKENKIREKQRIVKIVEYPDEPQKNTVEIANTVLSFEDVQKEFQDTSDTVNNITTDDGTIDGSTINGISTEQIYDFEASVGKITDLTVVNARIDELYAKKANISELNAVIANISELNATKANITDLNAINANIQNLIAADATINNALIGKADITELNAVQGNITSLNSEIANIKTLVNGNLSSENIQVGGITGDNLNMQTIFVKDANILDLSASKLTSGEIDTSMITIHSKDGGMRLVGSTQQFIDENNRIRIQLGKDAKGYFDFYILAENGDILFNTRGITGNAIENGLIKEDMVADGAIGGKKINWQSFVTEFNKDSNTHKLNSSKVLLDGTSQTLDVHFNSLKSTVDENVSQTESNTTQLNINQGEINTLIQDTTITKDGQSIKLKDDYNRTVSKVDYINSTIGTHTTKLDELTGNIASVDTKVNSVQRDLEGTKSTVSSHTSQINELNSTVSTQGSSINQLRDSIALKVEQSDINSAISTVDKKITAINNQVATIEINLSSITQRVSSTESTLDSHATQINAVDEKINTKVAEIKTTTDTITSKVEIIESTTTTINGNITNLQSKVSTVESKITGTAIVNTISEAITGGAGSINTTQFVMDKNGFTVSNGALKVKNKAGTTVLDGDSNGNLTIKNGCFKVLSANNSEIASINQNNWMRLQGLEVFGIGECMQNKGNGVRSLKLISTDGGAGHIDFNKNDSEEYTVRIIREANSTGLMILGSTLTLRSPNPNSAEGLEIRSNGNSAFIDFTSNPTDDYHGRILLKNNDKNLYTYGSGLVVNGNLQVTGSKNCLQATKNYGERLINAYETTECYYGDLGFGKINSDGECVVYIDDIFQECVNTNIQYHVFTQAYNGVINSIERHNTHFIVKGAVGTEFSWEVKAKRINHENSRLDVVEINNFTVDGLKTFSDEDFMIETAEESLLDTLTFNLEEILLMMEE